MRYWIVRHEERELKSVPAGWICGPTVEHPVPRYYRSMRKADKFVEYSPTKPPTRSYGEIFGMFEVTKSVSRIMVEKKRRWVIKGRRIIGGHSRLVSNPSKLFNRKRIFYHQEIGRLTKKEFQKFYVHYTSRSLLEEDEFGNNLYESLFG